MIVDTSALLAIFFDEAEKEAFTDAILDSEARMSAGTYIEASVVVWRRRPDKAARLERLVADLLLRLEPVTVEHARAARDGFVRFGQTRHPARLNFGDCFAYALARATGEPLLFKGEDFGLTDVRRAL